MRRGPALAIAWRDLRAALYAPGIWVLLGVNQAILGWIFLRVIERFTGLEAARRVVGLSLELSLNLYSVAALLVLFTAPLLAMRALSGERRDGTFPLLAAAPVRLVAIVVGKYLALAALMGLQVLLPVLLAALIAATAALDPGLLAAATLGLWLTSLLFAAIALFASSLSRHPVAAAALGYGLLLSLSIIGRMSAQPPGTVSLFDWLSWNEHLFWFLNGAVRLSDLAYYLLLIGLFLTLTHRHLANLRQA